MADSILHISTDPDTRSENIAAAMQEHAPERDAILQVMIGDDERPTWLAWRCEALDATGAYVQEYVVELATEHEAARCWCDSLCAVQFEGAAI